jgi:hypothetical protein
MQNDNFDSQKLIHIAIKSVKFNQNLIFDLFLNNFNTHNYFFLDESNIVIIKSGNYILSLSCEFYQNVVLGLKINEIIINEIQSEDNFINFHNVIKLNSNDIINFENISVNDIEVKNSLIINNNKIKLIKI